MIIKIDINEAEYLLSEFDGLNHRSKAVLFAYLLYTEEPHTTFSEIALNRGFDYSRCQSPIEEIFAVAFDVQLIDKGFPYCEALSLKPQKEIRANGNKYIADFCICAETSEWFSFDHDYQLIIECDGHEFHEKTKEQVTQRNQRDMDLKSAGYDVLHFSGSQIYQNPIECSKQALDYLMQKVGGIEFKHE